MPQPGKPAAGFDVLDDARCATIYTATRETGAYNHHSQLTWHGGAFWAMWSNHPLGEDGPGQRVLCATSPDAAGWSDFVELFGPPEPPRPSEETGLTLTAFRWLALDGRLFAVAGCHANLGFTDRNGELPPAPVRDAVRPSRARRGYSSLVREVRADGTFGPVFAVTENLAEGLAFDAIPARQVDEAPRLEAMLHSPDALPSWDFEKRHNFPRAADGHRLCEPTVYRAADGQFVMLLRDTVHSHRMYLSVSSDGRTWPPGEPTDIPDSPSLTTNVALPNAAVLLIGNQVAPTFDDWDEVRHHDRDPLVVSVSRDGYAFDRAWALRAGAPPLRIDGILGRGPGFQYPSALVRDAALYVQYSVGKEDVAVSWVPLAAMGL